MVVRCVGVGNDKGQFKLGSGYGVMFDGELDNKCLSRCRQSAGECIYRFLFGVSIPRS